MSLAIEAYRLYRMYRRFRSPWGAACGAWNLMRWKSRK